jgi:hypothetical protein
VSLAQGLDKSETLTWFAGSGSMSAIVLTMMPSVHQLLPNERYRGGPAGWVDITPAAGGGACLVGAYELYRHGVPPAVPPLFRQVPVGDGPTVEATEQLLRRTTNAPLAVDRDAWFRAEAVRRYAQSRRAFDAVRLPMLEVQAISQANIDLAESFHATYARAAHHRTRAVYGTEYTDTPVAVRCGAGGAVEAVHGPGDHTVPQESAAALPQARGVRNVGAEHAEMMQTKVIIDAVVESFWALAGAQGDFPAGKPYA